MNPTEVSARQADDLLWRAAPHGEAEFSLADRRKRFDVQFRDIGQTVLKCSYTISQSQKWKQSLNRLPKKSKNEVLKQRVNFQQRTVEIYD